MSMADKLAAKTTHLAPADMSLADWSKAGAKPVVASSGRSRPPVEDSDELRRIIALPRRPRVDLGGKDDRGVLSPPSATAQAYVRIMNARLSRGPRACACASMGRPCITSLMPAQAWALYEAPRVGGLLAPIGVGHGKTGIDILMAMVMPNCRLAVLLIPPGLRRQLLADYAAWAEHFHVPSLIMDGVGKIIPGRPTLHVIPYSKFSRPESTDLLEQLDPTDIFADEGHRLRYANTATTGRVLRRFKRKPETRLCVWSGTLTTKSIGDYSHLAAIALRKGSPLPLDPAEVDVWKSAIDPSDWPAPAGELRRLCAGQPEWTLYQGFQSRLLETQGVVATKEGAIDAAINLFERKAPPMPASLLATLRAVRSTEQRPDGEELVDALAIDAVARQVACGFYYRWKFPKGEPESLIDAWYAARKEWNKELREKLKTRVEHMDSPQLCEHAAARACQAVKYRGPLPVWHSDTWENWADIKDRVYHESEAIWLDDYLAHDAAAWGVKHRGVIWYEYDAFGERVAQLSGLPKHGGGGANAEKLILAEKGDRSIVASILAHGTGRDGLQRIFRDQLVANPPSSGGRWEQLLGRLHRIGQKADEVDAWVYRHTDEMRNAIDKAVIQSKYVRGTLDASQKLLVATCDFPLQNK